MTTITLRQPTAGVVKVVVPHLSDSPVLQMSVWTLLQLHVLNSGMINTSLLSKDCKVLIDGVEIPRPWTEEED
jgi:hypothetical protein